MKSLEYQQPPAIIVGLDNITGLQTARILARHKVPVIGLAKTRKHYCCQTNTCQHREPTCRSRGSRRPRSFTMPAQMSTYSTKLVLSLSLSLSLEQSSFESRILCCCSCSLIVSSFGAGTRPARTTSHALGRWTLWIVTFPLHPRSTSRS